MKNAYESALQNAYSNFYQTAYDYAEQQNHVSNYAVISIEAAKPAAVDMIGSLVQKWNPDIPDLQVDVEFFENN